MFLVDAMPHKTCTLLIGEFSHMNKMERPLIVCNAIGEKVGLKHILLSKLSSIKKTNFRDYITKRCCDKFARCSKYETLKRLQDIYTIGSESYVAHQLNYFKHINLQEAYCNDYYTNRVLSIARLLKVLTVILDKMDHAKTTSSCFTLRIKATGEFFDMNLSNVS